MTINHSHPGILLDPPGFGQGEEEGCQAAQLTPSPLGCTCVLVDPTEWEGIQSSDSSTFGAFPVLLCLKDFWPT